MLPQESIRNIDFRSIPLFSELEPSELSKVLSFSSIKRIKKGGHIFMEGDPYGGFFVVLIGSVRVYRNSRDGKELTLHLLNPLSLLAEVPIFEGTNYPANAQAMERTEVFFIPKEHFVKYLDSSPELMRKMLIGFAKKIRSLSDQLESLSLHDVSSRLARFLIVEVERAQRSQLPQPFIRLDAQKSVIASQIGTIRETLSRSLKRLQSLKIIRVKGHTITILDYARLKALTE
ncbi:MAG: Crp/Fnr family transcriptional regulator [Bacteroidota bacterium]|nr:Crp/Fnr family transcriptional regulator [Bacteroidota bacterium]